MHLEPKLDRLFAEHIENGIPPFGKFAKTGLDRLRRSGWKVVNHVPYGRSGKSVHNNIVAGRLRQSSRRTSRLFHLFTRPLPYSLRLAIAPNVRGQYPLMPFVDHRVTYRLPREMIRNRPTTQVILLECVELFLAVVLLVDGSSNLKMVSPAGQLEPVITPLARLLRHFLQRQIGPLPGKECYWTWRRTPTKKRFASTRLSSGALHAALKVTLDTRREAKDARRKTENSPRFTAIDRRISARIRIPPCNSPFPGHQPLILRSDPSTGCRHLR